MRSIYRCLIVIVLVFSSCNSIKEVMGFVKEIQSTYKVTNVKVANTDNGLTVSFVNTSYNDSSDEVKQRVAWEIGDMAQHYFKSQRIEKGQVNYVKEKGIAIANISTSNSFDMEIKKQNSGGNSPTK